MASRTYIKNVCGEMSDEMLSEGLKTLGQNQVFMGKILGKKDGTTDYYMIAGEINNEIARRKKAQNTDKKDSGKKK